MDQPDAPEHCLGPDPTPAPVRASTHAPPTDPAPVEVPPASASPSPLPDHGVSQPFGAALAPVLVNLCGGRLSQPNWFRTDWQRGGALTGYATWRDDKGVEHPAVVKLPVPPKERRWLVQLSSDDVTPRVFAHGSELGGYDLAWVVMERLPHGPLGRPWGSDAYDLLADAAANFYARARMIPMGDPPRPRDWKGQLKAAREHVGRDTIAHSQRWRKALKAAAKQLPGWLDAWHRRDTGTWCHGDLHPGNAMSRFAPPDGPAVLFDLACVRPGHWVEDAVYLEHLYWASPGTLHGTNPAKLIARSMRDYDLSPGENWPQLADIYRALLAMVAPAHLSAQGGAAHAAAALGVLERLL
ncbi:MAG: phosphotransferase [Phycisphaeraceae bacterium]